MADQTPAPHAPALPPYSPYTAQKAGTNTMAVVSLVGAFFVSLVGIICGHIALHQIRKTGESGRGLAIAGLILGYAGMALSAVLVTVLLIGTASEVSRAEAHASAASAKASTAASAASAARAADCAAVTAPGKALLASVRSALAGSAADPKTAQAGIKKATTAFEAATANVKDPGVQTSLVDITSSLDDLNLQAELNADIPSPRHAADLQAAADSLNSAWSDLSTTCGNNQPGSDAPSASARGGQALNGRPQL